MPHELKRIGKLSNVEYLMVDPDIFIVVPEAGFKDSVESAQIALDYGQNFVRQLGKKCGMLIDISNIKSLSAESRHVFASGTDHNLYFGVALVVTNPLTRAIGNFGMRLAKIQLPLALVDSIENGITWLESVRKA